MFNPLSDGGILLFYQLCIDGKNKGGLYIPVLNASFWLFLHVFHKFGLYYPLVAASLEEYTMILLCSRGLIDLHQVDRCWPVLVLILETWSLSIPLLHCICVPDIDLCSSPASCLLRYVLYSSASLVSSIFHRSLPVAWMFWTTLSCKPNMVRSYSNS